MMMCKLLNFLKSKRTLELHYTNSYSTMVKAYLCKTPVLLLYCKLLDTPPKTVDNQWVHISKKKFF